MKFAGEIFFTAPQVIDAGSTISIRVAGQASTNDWVEAFNHWHYTVTITLQNGMSASKKILVNDIVLENNYVKEFDETFNFPVLMPNYDITAEILIRCYVGQVSYYEDVVEEEILIETRGSGGGGGNGGGGGESETDLKKYLIPAAVGAGALILLAIAIGGKK